MTNVYMVNASGSIQLFTTARKAIETAIHFHGEYEVEGVKLSEMSVAKLITMINKGEVFVAMDFMETVTISKEAVA